MPRNFIVTYTKTSIQLFRLLGVYIRDSVQRMSLFVIIWLRLSPVTLPQYSLQICHRHACWLPMFSVISCLSFFMIPSLFSEASISAIDFTGISSPPCTSKWRSSLVFSTISTPTIPPLYVYNLVFGRSWETNGVGKQHWWDWGRFEDIRAEALTWLVSLNNNLTGSVGKRNIAKGWIKAGISELVQGKTILSPEDPFENIEAILI